jgi:hypothetical protein
MRERSIPTVHGSRAFEIAKVPSRRMRQFIRKLFPWRAAPKIATRLSGACAPSGARMSAAARGSAAIVPSDPIVIHDCAMMAWVCLLEDQFPPKRLSDCPMFRWNP